GVVGAVHPVAVALARPDVGEVRMPGEGVDLLEAHAPLAARVIEQAELYRLRDLGEQREVGAGAVIGRAEGIRPARPGLDGLSHAPPQRRPTSRVQCRRGLSLPRAGT